MLMVSECSIIIIAVLAWVWSLLSGAPRCRRIGCGKEMG